MCSLKTWQRDNRNTTDHWHSIRLFVCLSTCRTLHYMIAISPFWPHEGWSNRTASESNYPFLQIQHRCRSTAWWYPSYPWNRNNVVANSSLRPSTASAEFVSSKVSDTSTWKMFFGNWSSTENCEVGYWTIYSSVHEHWGIKRSIYSELNK